jgi:23S rRNA G2445 N2-methylase RlmL
LHKRGYRSAMHAASLRETLAAGCLELAGWGAAVDAALAGNE